MPRLYGDLPLAGSIVIHVPRKLLKFNKKDDVVIVDSLTKTKNLKTNNKTKSIKLVPVIGTKTTVESQGLIRPSNKEAREALAEKTSNEMEYIKNKSKLKKKST